MNSSRSTLKARHYTRAFTLVELLIVIVVIGLLAAIAIVAYNGIQNRGYDSAIQADLKTLGNKTTIAMQDTTDGYAPPATQAGLQSIMPKLSRNSYHSRGSSNGVALQYCLSSNVTPANKYFAWVAVSKSGNIFYYSSANGTVKQGGTATAWGGLDAAYTCAHAQTTNDSTNFSTITGAANYVVIYGQQGSNTAGPFQWASWAP